MMKLFISSIGEMTDCDILADGIMVVFAEAIWNHAILPLEHVTFDRVRNVY
jgi:hypothetical protein